MATLVTVERELKGVRQKLLMFRQYLPDMPAFQEIAELHREAADLVADIVAVDQDSVHALKNAEQARHLAAQTLDEGESTLALQ